MRRVPTAEEPATARFAERYGVDRHTMERLLAEALTRGGDYADVYCEHRFNRTVSFEARAVKGAGGNVMQGLGVRVASGHAVGHAYTERFTPAALRRAARTAARICAPADGWNCGPNGMVHGRPAGRAVSGHGHSIERT